MYTRRMQSSVRMFRKPNLAGQVVVKYFGNHDGIHKCGLLVKELFVKNILALKQNLKRDSRCLLRVWQHQCECVLAQRVRRGQQMFALYSRLWEEQALKQFVTNIRQHITRRGKELIFSTVGVAAYNWEENRIPEEELRTHFQEIEYIKILKDKTVNCSTCNDKEHKDKDKTIIAFCECDTRKDVTTYENWSLFIEQPDLIVWRRLHPSGSFEYKVYGSYNDVTAEDFLSVQIDTAYRKTWDPTAVELNVIEKDQMPDSNSDVVYWEMQWPRLFSNRDYVFKRRYLVDKEHKTVMLLSKSSEHPNYPQYSNKFRISDYWSSMVIKPYTEIDKPGIEFSLTYFDNPGVNIPASVTAWVAYRAMPDFLTRLRAATIKYKQYCTDHQCKGLYKYNKTTEEDLKASPAKRKILKDNVGERCTWSDETEEDFFEMLGNEFVPFQKPASQPEEESQTVEEQQSAFETGVDLLDTNLELDKQVKEVDVGLQPLSNAEILLSPSPIVQNDNSYWKYLQPTYYIS